MSKSERNAQYYQSNRERIAQRQRWRLRRERLEAWIESLTHSLSNAMQWAIAHWALLLGLLFALVSIRESLSFYLETGGSLSNAFLLAVCIEGGAFAVLLAYPGRLAAKLLAISVFVFSISAASYSVINDTLEHRHKATFYAQQIAELHAQRAEFERQIAEFRSKGWTGGVNRTAPLLNSINEKIQAAHEKKFELGSTVAQTAKALQHVLVRVFLILFTWAFLHAAQRPKSQLASSFNIVPNPHNPGGPNGSKRRKTTGKSRLGNVLVLPQRQAFSIPVGSSQPQHSPGLTRKRPQRTKRKKA